MSTKIFSLIVLASFLIFVIDLIRREKLTFKYAFGWLAAAAAGIMIVVFDRFFIRVSVFFGFELLSNFLFFCGMVTAVFLGLLLTVFLCQQSQRNECMAKKIALLEKRIENS